MLVSEEISLAVRGDPRFKKLIGALNMWSLRQEAGPKFQ
jgi:hypothetical protein